MSRTPSRPIVKPGSLSPDTAAASAVRATQALLSTSAQRKRHLSELPPISSSSSSRASPSSRIATAAAAAAAANDGGLYRAHRNRAQRPRYEAVDDELALALRESEMTAHMEADFRRANTRRGASSEAAAAAAGAAAAIAIATPSSSSSSLPARRPIEWQARRPQHPQHSAHHSHPSSTAAAAAAIVAHFDRFRHEVKEDVEALYNERYNNNNERYNNNDDDDGDDAAAAFHGRGADTNMDVDAMSYDQLLALGERLGDVKPRKPVATQYQIDSLPMHTFAFRPSAFAAMAASASTAAAAAAGMPTAAAAPAVSGGGGDDGCLDECRICLSDFELDDLLTTLPCLHRYHTVCAEPWLRECARCPICSTDVFPVSPLP